MSLRQRWMLNRKMNYSVSLKSFYKDCGAILISHRLSNVKTADNILVIGDGKIIEQGNHKELMKLNGKYARMYNLQAKKYSEITV